MHPHNKPTRGKTSPGRLHFLNHAIKRLHQESAQHTLPALDRDPFIAVDIGFGEHPHTSFALADLLRSTLSPAPIHLYATELDTKRAERARTSARPDNVEILTCGFELIPKLQKKVHLLRAANILRQYHPNDIPAIHKTCKSTLAPSGLFLEGTCDKHGDHAVFHMFRTSPNPRHHLLFFTSCSRGFAPIMMRDWLPQDLRRSVYPGTPIHAFFDAWTHAWKHTRSLHPTLLPPQRAFAESVRRLALTRTDVNPHLADEGYLLLDMTQNETLHPQENLT